jgi:cell shape-determining protein MreD
MRPDGLLATLDRWGRAVLPGLVLLFFVLLTLAPLRAPYLSDALPLLPALAVFQYSLATPERLPGLLLLVAGVLLDLLLGGPGAPVGVSALGFVLMREMVVANRRYLAVVPFLFTWMGFALLMALFVLLVWAFTGLFTWTRLPLAPALQQYIVILVLYPLIGPLLGRPQVRDPLNVPDSARGGPGSET